MIYCTIFKNIFVYHITGNIYIHYIIDKYTEELENWMEIFAYQASLLRELQRSASKQGEELKRSNGQKELELKKSFLDPVLFKGGP